MKNNEIDCIDIKDGQLYLHKKLKPITKKVLLNIYLNILSILIKQKKSANLF